ncbi:hypothetical protein L195_g039260, partial [Trifolium pratense]
MHIGEPWCKPSTLDSHKFEARVRMRFEHDLVLCVGNKLSFPWTWQNREMHDDARLRPTHAWHYILDCIMQYMTAYASNIALPARHKVE